MGLQFGRFVLDTGARRLFRDGDDVHLSPKAFTLLELLARRRPDAVSKGEIQDLLWPDTHVVEANVANLVGEIRAALQEDSRRPQWIRTLPRFGYAFAADGVTDRSTNDGNGRPPADRVPASPSLVVLPFANTSQETDQEYFSDGLTGEITNVLTHCPGLTVIARSSAFAFKGKSQDVRRVAEVLGVTHVLEGSVQRAGSRFRVTAHLVRAEDGVQLWSERYDRDVIDVLAVQDEIAMAIGAALSGTLPTVDTSHRHEPNLAAYEAYLKGRHHLPSRAPADRDANIRAIAFFKEAARLDPDWAQPNAELAYLYLFFAWMAPQSLDPLIASAREAATNALRADAGDSTSHAVLGAIAACYDYDWDDAHRRFRKALLSRTLPPAVHDLYAMCYLSPTGQFDAAIAQHARAIAQDPLLVIWRARQLMLFLNGEMYERAVREAATVLEYEPHSFLAQFTLAQARWFLGAPDDARAAAEAAHRLAPWHQAGIGLLAGILSQTGSPERAASLLRDLAPTTSAGQIYYHALSGDADAALTAYLAAAEHREPVAAELASAGFLRSLRSHPGWAAIARRMNLPA